MPPSRSATSRRCAAAAAKRATGTGYSTVTPWIGGPLAGSSPSW